MSSTEPAVEVEEVEDENSSNLLKFGDYVSFYCRDGISGGFIHSNLSRFDIS
jgi:hypothetical protein